MLMILNADIQMVNIQFYFNPWMEAEEASVEMLQLQVTETVTEVWLHMQSARHSLPLYTFTIEMTWYQWRSCCWELQ
jgi:hypothetical protein